MTGVTERGHDVPGRDSSSQKDRVELLEGCRHRLVRRRVDRSGDPGGRDPQARIQGGGRRARRIDDLRRERSPQGSGSRGRARVLHRGISRGKEEESSPTDRLLGGVVRTLHPPEKETLESPEISTALEECQVIHVDLDEYPELARAYGVTTIPDVVFVDPAGFVVDRLHGFESPSDFLLRLRKVTRRTTSMLQPLSEDGRELQQAFNAETGKVRLILLVSPG